MRVLVRSHHLWLGLCLLLTFCAVASVVNSKPILILSNSLVLVGSLAVGLAYIPVAIRAVRQKEDSEQARRVQHISLGICYAWMFSAVWRAFSLTWILTGGDEAWINNDLVALCQSGVFLGACYHLTSPGAVANLGLRQSHPVWLVGGVVLVSFALAGMLAFYPPDLSHAAAAVKPYLPR